MKTPLSKPLAAAFEAVVRMGQTPTQQPETQTMQDVQISFSLTNNEADALAEFCKRSRHDTFRACAIDDEEARLMIDAAEQLRNALIAAGYNPR